MTLRNTPDISMALRNTPDISMTLQATDGASSNPLTATAAAVITVLDENDNVPLFRSSDTVNVLEDEPAGYRLIQAGATDPDSGSNGKVTYSLVAVSSNAYNPDEFYDIRQFNLNPTTGISPSGV